MKLTFHCEYTSLAIAQLINAGQSSAILSNAYSGIQTAASNITSGITTMSNRLRTMREGSLTRMKTPDVSEVHTPIGEGMGILLIWAIITTISIYLKPKMSRMHIYVSGYRWIAYFSLLCVGIAICRF